MARAQRVEEARSLTDEEIAAIGEADGIPGIPLGRVEADLTEAEVALLEAKGAVVEFDELNPTSVKAGRLFRIGSGNSQFTGTLTHSSGDNEKIFMWRRNDGVRRALPKNQILYWVSVGFSPRPIPGVTPDEPMFKCTAPGCRKRLSSEDDQFEHFKRAHRSMFEARERVAKQRRENQLDDLLTSLAEGTGRSTDTAAIVAAVLEILNNQKQGEPVA